MSKGLIAAGILLVAVWAQTALAAGNSSQFVSQSVPPSMVAGNSYTISVTIKNTGTTNWTTTSNYGLGSQNPQDNGTWGMGRVPLGAGDSIAPGQTKTFSFSVTAPQTPGTYNMQWRMLQELVEWFGEYTPNVAVTVSKAPVPAASNLGDLWFSPNETSADWKQLFLNPDSWATARQNISVFQLGVDLPLTDAELDTLVHQIKSWNVGVSFEAPSVKPWRCTPDVASNMTLYAMNRVTRLGVGVNYIMMDEPLWGGDSRNSPCGLSTSQIASQVDTYIATLKQHYPDVQVGDIEPWPALGEIALKQWIDLLTTAPNPISSFELDVDYASAKVSGTPLSEIKDIADYTRSKGIPFRIIIWNSDALYPQSVADDATEYAATMQWAATVHALTSVDSAIVESWDQFPITTTPDSGLNTLTKLLRDYAAAYPPGKRTYPFATRSLPVANEYDAQFVAQSVPATMTPGNSYAVTVSMKNTGTTIWTTTSNYGLGSQNPQDNGTWGMGRVPLGAGDSIAPGQTKTFSFSVTAPKTPGTYNMQWRAIEEGVLWFGDPTPTIPVVVSTNAAVVCTPNWSCTAWNQCAVSGGQSRTCTDANTCGVSTGKPSESQSCTYASAGGGSSSGGGSGGGGGAFVPTEAITTSATSTVVVSLATAQTNDQKIAALRAQIVQLLALLAQLMGKSPSPTVTASPQGATYNGTCPVITRSLSRGMRGDDVSALQKFFFDKYQNFPSPTGFFGSTTEAALKQWQSEHAVVSSGTPDTTGYGATGPKTRAAIAACK